MTLSIYIGIKSLKSPLVHSDRIDIGVNSKSNLRFRIFKGVRDPQIDKFNKLASLEVVFTRILSSIGIVRDVSRTCMHKIVAA